MPPIIFSKKKQLLRKEIGMILTCLFSCFLYLRVILVLSVIKTPSACSVNQRWEIHVGCLINLGNICVNYIRSNKTNRLLFLRIIIKLIFLNLVSFFKIISKSVTKNDPAVLLSLDVAHVLMKDRKPFTEAESTIKKCIIKASERLHGGSKAVDRVKKSSSSDTTMARRCTLLKI